VLRALQEGVISRGRIRASAPVDVRVIAATNKNLGLEIEEDSSRRPAVPAQRRPDPRPAAAGAARDIPQLVTHFLADLTRKACRRRTSSGSRGATHRLTIAGNIRELKNPSNAS